MANGKQVQYDGRCMDQKGGRSWRRGKKNEVFSRVDTAGDYILKQMRACVRGAVVRLSGGLLTSSWRGRLDVEINTGADITKAVDMKVRYAGMERIMSAASQWKDLVITGCASKVDIDAH